MTLIVPSADRPTSSPSGQRLSAAQRLHDHHRRNNHADQGGDEDERRHAFLTRQ